MSATVTSEFLNMSPEMIDVIRYCHLLSVAIGLGAAFLADLQVFQRLNRPVTRNLLSQLALYHKLVWAGLAGMWITGLVLIYIKTGFIGAEFTPKLMSKIGIVSVLTLNALLIGRLAMPMLQNAYGQAPNDLPLVRKIMGGWLASLSSVSWLLALALGGSKVLAVSDWSTFAVLVPGAYLMGLVGSSTVVLALHFRERLLAPAPKAAWLTEHAT